jgi:RsiW-degrading membrane proteinase PrsW (M82 family)
VNLNDIRELPAETNSINNLYRSEFWKGFLHGLNILYGFHFMEELLYQSNDLYGNQVRERTSGSHHRLASPPTEAERQKQSPDQDG